MALSLYPECANDANVTPKWWDHLHCAMSHYKFVLAIENTFTESYVTEKLFYALDSGAVPIYFGAPNVRFYQIFNTFKHTLFCTRATSICTYHLISLKHILTLSPNVWFCKFSSCFLLTKIHLKVNMCSCYNQFEQKQHEEIKRVRDRER